MAIQIYQPGQAVQISSTILIVYGETNGGKTSFAATCRNPLLLDFDKGVHRAHAVTSRIPRAQPESWQDVVDYRKAGGFNAYDTIVIDTVTTCTNYLTQWMVQNDMKLGNGRGGLSPAGYGIRQTHIRDLVQGIRNSGKNVVLLAQHVDKEEGSEGKKRRPKAEGALSGFICEEADFVGYVHARNNKRVMGFTFNDEYYSKGDEFGVIELPDYSSEPDFGARLIDRMIESVNARALANTELSNIVADWQVKIDEWNAAADFQSNIADITKAPAGLQPQINALVRKRRLALKIEYDKEKKLFIDPKPEAHTPQEPAVSEPHQMDF